MMAKLQIQFCRSTRAVKDDDVSMLMHTQSCIKQCLRMKIILAVGWLSVKLAFISKLNTPNRIKKILPLVQVSLTMTALEIDVNKCAFWS